MILGCPSCIVNHALNCVPSVVIIIFAFLGQGSVVCKFGVTFALAATMLDFLNPLIVDQWTFP